MPPEGKKSNDIFNLRIYIDLGKLCLSNVINALESYIKETKEEWRKNVKLKNNVAKMPILKNRMHKQVDGWYTITNGNL